MGVAQPRCRAAAPGEGAGGGPPPPPQRFLGICWVGEGLWAYQKGQIAQKMVCFGPLRATRSRQDESKEVHEVGSKRPSSGCNGVHVLSLYPLIWRSLRRAKIRLKGWLARFVHRKAKLPSCETCKMG